MNEESFKIIEYLKIFINDIDEQLSFTGIEDEGDKYLCKIQEKAIELKEMIEKIL